MCHCTPEATAYRFCNKGECNEIDFTKKQNQARIEDQAYLYATRKDSEVHFYFGQSNEDKWKSILETCEKAGLTVIDTKALRKLENFHTKIDTAIRDYPNY